MSVFGLPLAGSLNFRSLPEGLETLHIDACPSPTTLCKIEVSGSFCELPESIRKLRISGGVWNMPLCLTGIPQGLQEIDINPHAFGNIDLRCDSPGVTSLTITHGSKQGTTSFIGSAPSLENLNLRSNKPVGSISFQGLGPCLNNLSIGDNDFHGMIVFETLPPSIRFISVPNTKFETIVFSAALPAILEYVSASRSGKSGTIDLRHFAQTTQTVLISENQLHGSVCIDHLVNLQSLGAGKNLFEGSIDSRNLSDKLNFLDLGGNKMAGTVDLLALPHNLQSLNL